ncbi:MAG: sigma-70 family RNA polymerase sigma factor [Candidatus Latescibacteria bacterium]|nr:sigma-70 family RNA polymerase sigma factor [Candidatus Latescibacterota bacterium]
MLMSDSKIEHGENLSDVQLLSDVVLGDIGAFEKIVNRYKGRLYNFVFRFVGDQETAEDIVQETFLRAYRRRREYRAIANFSTWLFTIAGNLAKSELRRRKRWRLLSLDWDDDAGNGMEIADESLRPDTMAESSMTDMRIQEAIDSLPSNYKQVVILRDIEGLSYQEIAEIVGCPVGTVKSRVNRGRLRLQQKLKIDGKDVGLEVK